MNKPDPHIVAALGRAPFGVFVLDANLRVIAANPAAHAAIGAAVAVGSDFRSTAHDLWPKAAVRQVLARFRETLATGTPFAALRIFRIRPCNGGIESYGWEIERVTTADGAFGVACCLVDLIGEYRPDVMPALALRESQRQLRAELADSQLLHNLATQLVQQDKSISLYRQVVAAARVIMHSSHACLQIYHPRHGPGGALRLITSLGFSRESVAAWKWVPADATTSCAEALRRGGRVIAPDLAKADFLTGAEERATYAREGVHAAQTTPLVTRAGKTVGMITTHWSRPYHPTEREFRLLDLLARQAADLIERAQTMDALRRKEMKLRTAARRKDEFLATLSHELRNPLAPIRAALDAMKLSGNAPHVVENARVVMDRQVSHMTRLVDDLLDVARITSGRIQLQRKPTLLRELVDAAVESTNASLRDHRVVVDVDIPDRPVWLDADATRFAQILSNVLHNAVKFSRAGQLVQLTANLTNGAGTPPGVRFVVSDEGAGISREFMPRIFEWFTQDDALPAGTRPGLGIGLALARWLVELHGGTIEAQSGGRECGSVFTIDMPHAAAADPAPVAATGQEAAVTMRRVLVIDDNVDAANAMARLIRIMGANTRVAYNGREGLGELQSFHPDVVLLDISMPEMDGYEVCRRIRSEVGNDVTVVALTGWGQEGDRNETAHAGFNLHLTKPADVNALQTLLATSPG